MGRPRGKIASLELVAKGAAGIGAMTWLAIKAGPYVSADGAIFVGMLLFILVVLVGSLAIARGTAMFAGQVARDGTKLPRVVQLRRLGYDWLSYDAEQYVASQLTPRQVARIARWEELATIPGLQSDARWLVEVLRASASRPGEPGYFLS